MRSYLSAVLLLSLFVTVSCRKENLTDNPANRLQGSWKLIANNQLSIDSTNLQVLTFNGSTMLTYHHDTLVSKENFLLAIKADKLPYLVSDKDPWNPRIYSCTFCNNSDTLYLSAVHMTNGAKATYVRYRK